MGGEESRRDCKIFRCFVSLNLGEGKNWQPPSPLSSPSTKKNKNYYYFAVWLHYKSRPLIISPPPPPLLFFFFFFFACFCLVLWFRLLRDLRSVIRWEFSPLPEKKATLLVVFLWWSCMDWKILSDHNHRWPTDGLSPGAKPVWRNKPIPKQNKISPFHVLFFR